MEQGLGLVSGELYMDLQLLGLPSLGRIKRIVGRMGSIWCMLWSCEHGSHHAVL